MKLGVVIPYRETPSRIPPFKKVLEWYAINLPNAKIYVCDAPGEYWQPSKTRNIGVEQATKDGCDVIIMNDADTIPEINPLLEAINSCIETKKIHNPYTWCHSISIEGTEWYINQNVSLENTQKYSSSTLACFGVIVFTPQTWLDLGGMDEKFIQWGPEDRAFEHAHLIIKGSNFIKHNGNIFCLAHASQLHDKDFNKNSLENRELYMKYVSINSPEQILKLVKATKEELINFPNLYIKTQHTEWTPPYIW